MLKQCLSAGFLLVTVIFGVHPVAHAQDILTIDQAIRIGLENNYSIRIARNVVAIAENNNSLGNAGFLPQVNVSGNQNTNITNSRQEYAFTDEVNERTGAQSQSLGSNVALNWTIFDGFRMFVTRQKLNELEAEGELSARVTIEGALSDIISAYYTIVREKQTLEVLREAVTISRERLNIAREKLDLGSGSGLETLQARADLNSDSSAFVRQEVNVRNAKIAFNELLAREPGTEFTVSNAIPIQQDLALADLESRLENSNNQLQRARVNQTIARLNLQQVQSERYPSVALNAGYNFSRSESESGFLSSNRSSGYNFGLTASFNLFDGFDLNRRVQNAKLDLRTSEYHYRDVRNTLRSTLQQIYENYQSNLQLLGLEQENVEVARQTVEVAQERYRLGTITQLELREAQRSFIQAESRLVNVQYQGKLAETELKSLTGQLLRLRTE
ncbi:MAG TPA: TolC family protein [bacterium]|nr:TolC family protein [bacterium]